MSLSFQATNFAGGSRSEEFEDSSRGSIFQPGVKALYPSAKKILRVRVLPAFDRSMSINDLAFPTSVVPYRDVGIPQDSETKSEGFTSWYLVVVEYTMIGNSKFSFLSPVTLANLGVQGDVRDPMQMIRRFAKDNPKWKHLMDVKIGSGKSSTDLLPKLKSSAIMNVLLFDERSGAPSDVNITKISWTALTDLKNKLTAPRPAGQNPIGPSDWENRYMLGDITSPQFGLLGTIESQTIGTVSTNGFRFSAHPQVLQGHMTYPIDVNTPFGKEVLAKRYDLFSDKTLKAISFQEIVNWVVQDGTIPYELVQEALGGCCNVPAAPANRQVVSYPNGQVAGQPGGFSAQPASPQGAWAPQAAAAPQGAWAPQAAPVAPQGAWAPQPAPAAPVAPQGAWAPQAAPQGAWAPQPAPAAMKEDVPYTFSAPAAPAPAALPVQTPAAPAPMAPPPPPPRPAAPAPAVEPKFWFDNNGTVMLVSRSEIMETAKAGYAGPVMAENQQGGWVSLASLGLAPQPTQATVPASAFTAPGAPALPQVSAVFQQGPTIAPAAAIAPAIAQAPMPMAAPSPAAATAHSQQNNGIATPVTPALAPPASALSPEEQTKLNHYIAAVSSGQTLSPDQLKDYAVLMTRFSSKAA